MREWGYEQMVPSSFNLTGHDTYEDYLQALSKKESGFGKWVPNSKYFLLDDNERIVAMVDIRHELNEFLYNVGGHIGYSTRSSERQKGYATLILEEALLICQNLGTNHVLVTCEADNIGSVKVILNNGGVENKSCADADGMVKRRFWIDNRKC